MATRIVNASPLIVLSKVGHFELIRLGVDSVLVPEAVLDEVAALGPLDPTLQAVRNATWLQVLAAPAIPLEIARHRLGTGESSVIALALSTRGAQALLDDLAARKCAESLGVPTRGTISLLAEAKSAGVIPAIRPILDRLRSSGMYLSDGLVRKVLLAAGEET